MCVVIIGGNECMVRQYKNLCREYRCNAKVYPKQNSSLKGIGNPDLLVHVMSDRKSDDSTGK